MNITVENPDKACTLLTYVNRDLQGALDLLSSFKGDIEVKVVLHLTKDVQFDLLTYEDIHRFIWLIPTESAGSRITACQTYISNKGISVIDVYI